MVNYAIFYNVLHLCRVLGRLQPAGWELDEAAVAALSRHPLQHINRFGHYQLDMDTRPPELVYDLRP